MNEDDAVNNLINIQNALAISGNSMTNDDIVKEFDKVFKNISHKRLYRIWLKSLCLEVNSSLFKSDQLIDDIDLKPGDYFEIIKMRDNSINTKSIGVLTTAKYHLILLIIRKRRGKLLWTTVGFGPDGWCSPDRFFLEKCERLKKEAILIDRSNINLNTKKKLKKSFVKNKYKDRYIYNNICNINKSKIERKHKQILKFLKGAFEDENKNFNNINYNELLHLLKNNSIINKLKLKDLLKHISKDINEYIDLFKGCWKIKLDEKIILEEEDKISIIAASKFNNNQIKRLKNLIKIQSNNSLGIIQYTNKNSIAFVNYPIKNEYNYSSKPVTLYDKLLNRLDKRKKFSLFSNKSMFELSKLKNISDDDYTHNCTSSLLSIFPNIIQCNFPIITPALTEPILNNYKKKKKNLFF